MTSPTGRYLSTFSGIGGLDLAVEAFFGYEPAAFVEWDQSCQRVLARHWPGVPIFGDIREFQVASLSDPGGQRHGGGKDGRSLGRVDREDEDRPRQRQRPRTVAFDRGAAIDLVCGGFPCQDLSNAGKRTGFKGDRSSLFYEFARVVSEVGPRFVLLENVRGLLTAVGSYSNERGAAMAEVTGTLADLGFTRLDWVMLGASDVGAPHRRNRIFILASRGKPLPCERRPAVPANTSRSIFGWGDFEPAIRRWEDVMGAAPNPTADDQLSPDFVTWLQGFPSGWNAGETRSNRLKQLGNAVVWQQAYRALQLLAGP